MHMPYRYPAPASDVCAWKTHAKSPLQPAGEISEGKCPEDATNKTQPVEPPNLSFFKIALC
jgi:hypothetical protein